MGRVQNLVLALSVAATAAGAQDKKIKVAVIDFSYREVQESVNDLFGSDLDIGTGIADLVSADLKKSGRFDVSVRHNLAAATRADLNAACQLPAQLGVDVVIMGDVTGYGQAQGEVAGVNVRVGRIGIGRVGRDRTQAAVILTASFVGPSCFPIAAGAGTGTASGSGTSLRGELDVAGISAGGKINMSGDEYQKTTIGKATMAAVSTLAKELNGQYDQVKGGLVPVAPVAAPAAMPAVALPSGYGGPISGPFVWGLYQFKGTEHFKYDASMTDGGETQKGWYTLDAKPAANNMFQLTVAGELGTDSFRSSSTTAPGQGIPFMQMAAMGPGAIVLFSPMYGMLMGQQWQVGSEWSFSSDGESVSFKVEEPCSYAGVSGLRGVWRQNNKIVVDLCASPNVALPLAVTLNDEDGETSQKMVLVEFRP